MDTDTIQRIRTRCQNAAFRLQAEAYAAQSNNGKRSLRQFLPCAKGLIFSRELARETPRVLSEIELEAVLTPCDCGCKSHNALTVMKIIAYSCDSTSNPYAQPNPGVQPIGAQTAPTADAH